MKHPHTIRTCRFFLEGICDFPDNVCWFNHTDDKTNNLVPQTLKQFKCGICAKDFKTKSDFMRHRKREHIEHVSAFRDYPYGCCRFGSNTKTQMKNK